MLKMYRSGIKIFGLLLMLGTILTACYSNPAKTPTIVNIPSYTPSETPPPTATITKTLPACVPVTITSVVTATTQPSQITTSAPPENHWLAYELYSLECRKNECLFLNKNISDLPVGLATVEGYYSISNHIYMDGNSYPCDSLVVTGGSFFIVPALYNLMTQKRVDSNERNQPMITIDLNGLEPQDVTLIKTASLDKPVSLWILLHAPVGRGAMSPCETKIEILKLGSVKKP